MLLMLRSFAGVGVLRKTVGGGAKLRTHLRINKFSLSTFFNILPTLRLVLRQAKTL